MSRAGTLLTIAPHWAARLHAWGYRTLDDLFAVKNDAGLAKPGLPRWRERLRVRPEKDAPAVYIKRFHGPPLREQFRRVLEGDPNHGTAWTEWNWLHRLAAAGVPAPAPIAYGEEMLGIWESRSALVLDEVPGISLERWCDQNRESMPQRVRGEAARVVSRFHAMGIAHRDLYLSHVFCDDPRSSVPRVSLIDFQRVRRLGWRRRRWIVKDLGSLHYSTPEWALGPRERLRWLKQYLGVSRFAPKDRILARLIAGKAERIRRHDARAGRVPASPA